MLLDNRSDSGENQFFDALEEIAVFSDGDDDNDNSVSSSAQFDVWVQNPESVEARRGKFLKWLGLGENTVPGDDSEECTDFGREFVGVRNEGYRHGLSYSMSSLPCDVSSSSGNATTSGRGTTVGDSGCQDEGFVSIGAEKPVRCTSLPSFSTDKNRSMGPTKKVRKWWLNRLKSFTCVVEKGDDESYKHDLSSDGRIQRVKVHQLGKESKELSALYSGQTIHAHKGAILTMKFSPDGKYLASAGEDRVVRVWRITENVRLNERDIPVLDSSCVYFTMNQKSELKPISTEKGGLRKNSDSSCVVLPPKVFRVLEDPLHEFCGHTGEILDLSWSRDNWLLSSSVDKTVRLWQVGHDHCHKVFPHNNYVTCVEFNPKDEKYFISGSIDGKVRIWEISRCKVVYWTEIKDIVTAICYRPDGRGGIIGSRSGSCRFFSISDDQLQLHAQISLHNKKSSGKIGKRITGFQFLPRDPSKVMISCADSQVRVVQGVDVIGKYKAKGTRTTGGTFSSAHFTSDGKRIVLATEDSSVHIWKCVDHNSRESSHIKKVKSSERFISNASVALPWPGLQNKGRGNTRQTHFGRSFSPVDFSCSQDFFLDLNYPKGSALWPEEKLLGPVGTSSMHKSEYKFLRTCQNRSESHAWGMVIVTGGWDGTIRSFHNYGLPAPL